MKGIKMQALLMCSECEFKQQTDMPVIACQHFYKCANCGKILKPKGEDCCVFCSYSNTKCPPKQMEENYKFR